MAESKRSPKRRKKAITKLAKMRKHDKLVKEQQLVKREKEQREFIQFMQEDMTRMQKLKEEEE